MTRREGKIHHKVTKNTKRMRFSETIKHWFDENPGGSLLLPDGWYGRPYDNQHMLTSIQESDQALTLVLDRNLSLHFDRLVSVEASESELALGPFANVRIDRGDDGTGVRHDSVEYKSGIVKIVRAPG